MITQYVDYNLFKDHDPEHAFLLQDASYPTFAAWLLEGLQPSLNFTGVLKKAYRMLCAVGKLLWANISGGTWTGSVGNLLNQIIKRMYIRDLMCIYNHVWKFNKHNIQSGHKQFKQYVLLNC